MGQPYPEDLIPENVIVPLSEGTEIGRVDADRGSDLSWLLEEYSALMGHDTNVYSERDVLLAGILTELRSTRILLTEIRDLANSVKIPTFLKGRK